MRFLLCLLLICLTKNIQASPYMSLMGHKKSATVSPYPSLSKKEIMPVRPPIEKLPYEILMNILLFLECKDLKNAIKTCKRFYFAINNKYFLKKYYSDAYLFDKLTVFLFQHFQNNLPEQYSYDIFQDFMQTYFPNPDALALYIPKNEEPLVEKNSYYSRYYVEKFTLLKQALGKSYFRQSNSNRRTYKEYPSVYKDCSQSCVKNTRYYFMPPIPNFLEIIVIKNKGLRALPENLGFATNLTSISLPNNYLSTLPFSFSQLTNLVSLDLSQNIFRICPLEITRLSHLCFLSFEGNLLTGLSSSFDQLTQLTILNLNQNLFEIFPDIITSLPQLKILSCNKNRLKSLPETFTNLETLNYLSLNENNFTIFPPQALRLPQLTFLSVKDNPLRTRPKVHPNLLRTLYLDVSVSPHLPHFKKPSLKKSRNCCTLY